MHQACTDLKSWSFLLEPQTSLISSHPVLVNHTTFELYQRDPCAFHQLESLASCLAFVSIDSFSVVCCLWRGQIWWVFPSQIWERSWSAQNYRIAPVCSRWIGNPGTEHCRNLLRGYIYNELSGLRSIGRVFLSSTPLLGPRLWNEQMCSLSCDPPYSNMSKVPPRSRTSSIPTTNRHKSLHNAPLLPSAFVRFSLALSISVLNNRKWWR